MSLIERARRRFGLRKENVLPAAAIPSPPTPSAAAAGPALPDMVVRLRASMPPAKPFPALPGSDAAALARIGADVVTRLAVSPGVVRVPAHQVDMYVVERFLTEVECDALVAMIDGDVMPSTSLRDPATPLRRTSETCRLSAAEPLVAAIETRMATLLGQPLSHSETLQGQRYKPGQQFKLHNDYFAGGQVYSDAIAIEGGQRTWTAMVFLDEPVAGGHTRFPRALVEIAPRRGALLTWNNMDRHGMPNRASDHEGTMVTDGIKHVLTKWFRERAWQGSETSDALRR